jgi:hypothetical protein
VHDILSACKMPFATYMMCRCVGLRFMIDSVDKCSNWLTTNFNPSYLSPATKLRQLYSVFSKLNIYDGLETYDAYFVTRDFRQLRA